jgi:hypothetical protein
VIPSRNGFKSLHFPSRIFSNVYVMKPNIKPLEMLVVSGMIRMVRKHGSASSQEPKSIRVIYRIMKTPTMIKAGAVA